MSSMGKAVTIGGTAGGAGAVGFLSGIAVTEGLATVICPPAGIVLGIGVGIGAGLGAIGKVIFG